MKLYQVGENKITRSPIMAELTYEFFSQHIGWEWSFTWRNTAIDIATHRDNANRVVYELNINGYDSGIAEHYEFASEEELLRESRIQGKTIQQIWDELAT